MRHHEIRSLVKNIINLQLGIYSLNTWYWSPYSDQYLKSSNK